MTFDIDLQKRQCNKWAIGGTSEICKTRSDASLGKKGQNKDLEEIKSLFKPIEVNVV